MSKDINNKLYRAKESLDMVVDNEEAFTFMKRHRDYDSNAIEAYLELYHDWNSRDFMDSYEGYFGSAYAFIWSFIKESGSLKNFIIELDDPSIFDYFDNADINEDNFEDYSEEELENFFNIKAYTRDCRDSFDIKDGYVFDRR